VAAQTVASLRASAGADLDDPRLTALVGELSLKSEDFRRLWARHDVRAKTAGIKRFLHPMVGELTLSYESFTVNGAAGQMLLVYHAEPGSPSEQALALLGSMTAETSLGRGVGQLRQIEVERGQQPSVLDRVDLLGQLPVDEVGSGVLAALSKNGDDNFL